MSTTTFTFDVAEGNGPKFDIDLSTVDDIAALQHAIGQNYGVVRPEGLSFHSGSTPLVALSEIQASEGIITIKVDGHALRDIPGPSGLPVVGNYLEVFPDHLGNNQRLFDRFGPLFQVNSLGRILCQTNDPELAQICLTESQFFSKEIVPDHPLYPIKNQEAGVFLGDTSNPDWKVVHKFLPPALGPKAVRHYAPQMNRCLEEAFPVFDELEKQNKAWNAYQYMLKLSSGTVGKIMLGKDLEHFTSVDAPLHRIILAIAEVLVINKKISSRGEWYAHLPFGDPKRLKNLQQFMADQIQEAIDEAESNGTEDLELQDAALKAANVVDYLVRAADGKGEHLPKKNLLSATVVATGAGFTTTSSLLSWCLYSLVAYPGTQARILQELIDHDITDETSITAEQIDELEELGKFVKETQRRHNPSYQPGRTAQQDMILPGGYRLKKGTVVVSALHHIHNNPAIWDNPSRFDPDRWDTEQVQQRHKASYIPFAMGQRMCIGFNFALLEVKIFLCKLVYRYHWEKEGDAETEYDPYFQLIRPVNLYLRTQTREQWPSKSTE
ncbi:cytochrome P450 [Lipomyces kononenkoae]|uniref:Cytochrome P450 n=1 Tax=Lipomyces kononenkoae TaxID=34357 RepID=A0ACC3SS66_LIPKO